MISTKKSFRQIALLCLFYFVLECKNLQELCKGKSISKIAKEMGMNHQTLQRYLHNEMEISLENLCKIANYFEEDLDFLTGRKS